MSDDEKLAWVALNALAEPGNPRLGRMAAAMGPVELVERLSTDADLEGLRSEIAERLAGLDPTLVLEQAATLGIRFVTPGDPEWPSWLGGLSTCEPVAGMSGMPLGLWVKGPARLAPTMARSVAIVGSRSATSYGTSLAGDLAAHVAGAGTTVVSGAAFGIDQAAHRGALSGSGPTVAVLACGLDRAYPSAHKALIDYIAEHGCLVSELRPGCSPTRSRFLGRNRLIAAMTQGTVVVEAAVRSGALNTANWAQRMQRVLMGTPGPVTSAPSEGVHELLRSGAAVLVSRGEHVLDALAPVGESTWTPPRAEETPFDALDAVDRRVLEAVPLRDSATTTSIARTAGIPRAVALSALGRLHSEGWVAGNGTRWVRTDSARMNVVRR